MKIFVIVGSLFPFDRLISTIDAWAATRKDIEITAQIGKSNFTPINLKYYVSLGAKEFNSCFSQSDLIISHAGMGVILKSLVENKPLLILPRRLEYKEHTTDHQMATVNAFSKMHYINIAMDTDALIEYLKEPERIVSRHQISPNASESLINTLRGFIEKNIH